MSKVVANVSVLETYCQNVQLLVQKSVRKENVLLKMERKFAYAMMGQEIILSVKDHVLKRSVAMVNALMRMELQNAYVWMAQTTIRPVKQHVIDWIVPLMMDTVSNIIMGCMNVLATMDIIIIQTALRNPLVNALIMLCVCTQVENHIANAKTIMCTLSAKTPKFAQNPERKNVRRIMVNVLCWISKPYAYVIISKTFTLAVQRNLHAMMNVKEYVQ